MKVEGASKLASLTKDDIQFMKKKPDLCQYICGWLGQTAISLVNELMEMTSGINGDDVWLVCLHEVVECRKELDDYEEEQYANYSSALYKALYKCIGTKSKESLSCSGRYMLTLARFVAQNPTFKMWTTMSKVSLDCRQQWNIDDKVHQQIAEYTNKLSPYCS